mmetsp:Transcript_105016/g.185527  ORF Transcript_105016/g.185527 Transcript_105016/m.185527 type:complete len:109 (-) Transcript_105016:17-343(-)
MPCGVVDKHMVRQAAHAQRQVRKFASTKVCKSPYAAIMVPCSDKFSVLLITGHGTETAVTDKFAVVFCPALIKQRLCKAQWPPSSAPCSADAAVHIRRPRAASGPSGA